MERIPKGFGLKPSGSMGVSQSKKVDPPTVKATEPVKEKSPKKRPASSNAAPASKKIQNLVETSAMVAKDFEKHALLHIEQKELDAWKVRSKEEAKDAIQRATSELFFHNVVEESMRTDDVARSHTLEIEKRALLKELKESKKALEKYKQRKKPS